MHFSVLATDYDGTLAHDGVVDDLTVAALDRLRASGRKMVLVTGRHLPDLRNVFPRLELFDLVIVENGGVLYNPATRQEQLLCVPRNERFLATLTKRNIPYSAGRTIVATWRPYDSAVLDTIRDLGLDLYVIFNKESVMVLPSGVNKGTALQVALEELGMSLHNAVAVGDAENDLPLMRASAVSAAVANALPSVQQCADIILEKPRGAGVTELIDHMIADDLAQFHSTLLHNRISVGECVEKTQSPLSPESQVIVSPRG